MLIFGGMLGGTGVILNSRPILAVYTLALWPTFICLMAIGYITYRREAFALEHKLDFAWSQFYTPAGRLAIQDSLSCCGYYNALHDAIGTTRCYPRTILPGCKARLLRFERGHLKMVWQFVFGVAPFYVLCMICALTCANHITHRFGKGLTPKKYRLCTKDVRDNFEQLKVEQLKAKHLTVSSDPSWLLLDQESSLPSRPDVRSWQTRR